MVFVLLHQNTLLPIGREIPGFINQRFLILIEGNIVVWHYKCLYAWMDFLSSFLKNVVSFWPHTQGRRTGGVRQRGARGNVIHKIYIYIFCAGGFGGGPSVPLVYRAQNLVLRPCSHHHTVLPLFPATPCRANAPHSATETWCVTVYIACCSVGCSSAYSSQTECRARPCHR